MARLNWDSLENRTYEAGVDRGVLYHGPNNFGVVWNGLMNVTTRVTSAETAPSYQDGIKVRHNPARGELEGSIEAYTYPDEFIECEGLTNLNNGLFADQQNRSSFGLSYRTKVGSYTGSWGDRYRIHIVYNAIATPSDRSNQSIGSSIDPTTFSWNIQTLPEIVSGLAPTAHFVIDSAELGGHVMNLLQDILYGKSGTTPQLPSGQHLVDFLESWTGLGIVPNPTTGIANLTNLGPNDDLAGDLGEGLYTRDPDTRLTPTAIPGFYRLE